MAYLQEFPTGCYYTKRRNRKPSISAWRACVWIPLTHIIIIIIIIIIRWPCLLSQAFPPQYFSWTNSDLHRSDCGTFRIVCAVPCTAAFVVTLLNVILVQLPNFSIKLLLLFRWLHFYRYNHIFHSPHSLYLYTSFLILFFSFLLPLYATFLTTGIATSISMHVYFHWFLISICGLFVVTSLSDYPLIP